MEGAKTATAPAVAPIFSTSLLLISALFFSDRSLDFAFFLGMEFPPIFKTRFQRREVHRTDAEYVDRRSSRIGET
jgi:hypothetical protein